jgi:hypothetical protein
MTDDFSIDNTKIPAIEMTLEKQGILVNYLKYCAYCAINKKELKQIRQDILNYRERFPEDLDEIGFPNEVEQITMDLLVYTNQRLYNKLSHEEASR